ncbi:MAG: hypothetical protein Q9170_003921, partial [Blastenia crenularia]
MEAVNADSDLNHFPSKIAAKDERVLDPGKHHIADDLLAPVDRIDSNSSILDNDL